LNGCAYDSLRDTTSSDKAIRREWGPHDYKIVRIKALEQGAKADGLMMQVEELMRDIEELMTVVRFLRSLVDGASSAQI